MKSPFSKSALSPARPRLLTVLDDWIADNSSDSNLELSESMVTDQDFSGVERLEAEGCTFKNVILTA